MFAATAMQERTLPGIVCDLETDWLDAHVGGQGYGTRTACADGELWSALSGLARRCDGMSGRDLRAASAGRLTDRELPKIHAVDHGDVRAVWPDEHAEFG